MAFTYDVTTTRGKVRLTISDVNSAAYAFEDAEIDYFITTGVTVQAAAILAMKVLLADRARRSKQFSIGGQFYNDGQQVAGIVAWLKANGGDMPTCTTVLPAELPFDASYDEVVPS